MEEIYVEFTEVYQWDYWSILTWASLGSLAFRSTSHHSTAQSLLHDSTSAGKQITEFRFTEFTREITKSLLGIIQLSKSTKTVKITENLLWTLTSLPTKEITEVYWLIKYLLVQNLVCFHARRFGIRLWISLWRQENLLNLLLQFYYPRRACAARVL